LKLQLNRNWEILLVFLVMPLQVVSGDLFVLVSGEATPYPLLNFSIRFLAFLRQYLVPLVAPILVAVAIACLCLPLAEKKRRLLIDVMYGFVALRLALLFFILNLMIFLPPSDRVLLFAQLLLFLPCLLLVWGWIYWRVDSYSVQAGKGRIFSSSTSDDEIPPPFDYFIASFTSLLTQTLDNFNAKTRFGRSLIFVHGIMVWDIMGLALSRAIALAAV
jgi:hypothetical protein